MTQAALRASCCIAGGGPAGMVLGLLLARAGIATIVLEKHADFLRDFRGDTIHPSTMEVMREIGLLDAFLRLPHQKAISAAAQIGDRMLRLADFTHLPTACKFAAFMPQWDFLDFLAEEARRHPAFRLVMSAEVTGLIEEDGRIAGVRAVTPEGPVEIRADLTIGADGRHSTVRRAAGLATIDLGAPIDVVWLRLPRRAGDARQVLGRIDAGRFLVMLDRDEYWQCAFVIPKGGLDRLRAGGLEAFRRDLARLAGLPAERTEALRGWDDVKLLTVAVDRLRRWHRPGLLCIGDAAHAMSPVGGVGINLAIQDAVAAANILAGPLAHGAPGERHLRAVQRRRMLPTRITQRAQVLIQNRVIGPVLLSAAPPRIPLALRLLDRWPLLRRLPARAIGLGVRPEHVKTRPAAAASGSTRRAERLR